MISKKRKGLVKCRVDTKILVDGEHHQDDILFCACKLEYPKHTEIYSNVVYCPMRNNFISYMSVKLKNKMPNTIHLKIIKCLGKAQDIYL